MNIIIGSNTEARIFSLFNPHYVMLEHKEFGSTFSDEYKDIIDLVVLLTATDNNLILLKRLFPGLDFKDLEIPIRYRYYPNGSNMLSSEIDKSDLLLKKLDMDKLPINYVANKRIDFCKHKFNVMNVFDVKTSEVRDRLMKAANAPMNIDHIGKIAHITSNQIIGEGGTIEFEQAISTISAKKMAKFSKLEPQSSFITKSSRLILLMSRLQFHNPEILYIVDHESPYNRININGQHAVVDITQGSGKHFKSSDFPGWEFKTELYLEHGKIIENQFFRMPVTIEPLGRFAQWNPDVKIEDIVARALQQHSLGSIFQRQKNIAMKYIDRPKTLAKREELTKEYIVHMMHEATSLLNELNWKIADEGKPLEYEKIVQEWVDIFKYWLSIGIIWDISIDDFIAMDQQRSIHALTKKERLNGKVTRQDS